MCTTLVCRREEVFVNRTVLITKQKILALRAMYIGSSHQTDSQYRGNNLQITSFIGHSQCDDLFSEE